MRRTAKLNAKRGLAWCASPRGRNRRGSSTWAAASASWRSCLLANGSVRRTIAEVVTEVNACLKRQARAQHVESSNQLCDRFALSKLPELIA